MKISSPNCWMQQSNMKRIILDFFSSNLCIQQTCAEPFQTTRKQLAPFQRWGPHTMGCRGGYRRKIGFKHHQTWRDNPFFLDLDFTRFYHLGNVFSLTSSRDISTSASSINRYQFHLNPNQLRSSYTMGPSSYALVIIGL